MELTSLCETFHCLPSDLLAEDPYWIERMKMVLEARAEYEKEKQRRAPRAN